MSARLIKQLLVLAVFLGIIGGGVYLIYWLSRPPAPTPTPDPLGNLLPIQVLSNKLLDVQNNDYDFVARVKNPNFDYGSGNVAYELKLYDAGGKYFNSKTGSFHVLPGQTKYVIESPVNFGQPISKAELVVKSVDWQKLDPLAADGTELVVKNADYVAVSQPGSFSKGGGIIVNSSDFDFDSVNVMVVAVDSSGTILAVNKTIIKTFLAHTERGYEVVWFTPFVGKVNHLEVEPQTNVFDNLNFIHKFGQTERFQKFY